MRNAYNNLSLNDLPALETATDVIDLLAMSVADMVVVESNNIYMTEDEFSAAFARAFDYALPKLLERLDRVKPGLADRVRCQFVFEYEDALTA